MKKTKMKTLTTLIVIVLTVSALCCACEFDETAGPRKVVQKYFDALKIGDSDAAISCFTPPTQKKLNILMGLEGGVLKALTGIDVGDIGGVGTGEAARKAYENCTFTVDNVEFTDEQHEHAKVHVVVDGATGWIPKEDTLRTVKYQGDWYLDQ